MYTYLSNNYNTPDNHSPSCPQTHWSYRRTPACNDTAARVVADQTVAEDVEVADTAADTVLVTMP